MTKAIAMKDEASKQLWRGLPTSVRMVTECAEFFKCVCPLFPKHCIDDANILN